MKLRALLLASLLATTATAGENTFNIYFKGDVRDHFLGQTTSKMTLARMNWKLKKNSTSLFAIDQNASGKYGPWHTNSVSVNGRATRIKDQSCNRSNSDQSAPVCK